MEFLDLLWLGKPAWMWLAFIAVIITLLVLDLGVVNRKDHEIGVRESLKLSAFYIFVGLAFGGWVAWEMGREAGVAYLTGFVVEKSLALDNVFVIAMIFAAFGVPREYQHRVLFWGILGVIVLRAVMIGLGAAMVEHISWTMYLFSAILIFTGIKMLMTVNEEQDVANSALLRFLRRHLRVTERVEGHHFFVRRADKATGRSLLYVTPLFLALVMIEIADVIFAVDSVPAIFAITTDPYLVYTSNIFAILGLRALYFALAAMVHRFHYLKYALGALLVFIGGKILVADALGIGKVPPSISLGVTAVLLAGGIGWSMWKTRGDAPTPASA
ncbi:tellurite resistance protein TerC [Sphingobium fontiphilum]|uniref:Tellurite resistance protein TerC n=1 Tax=Sphingobium fontiphilum TaxID=944425 RepID=A0A7W6DCT0_9SPHN|nr:TerC family protein [Sphingobium fontiphilum]MBB3980875.1 tellurite resistance protein TerC [Sphingobium fontiphilum]